MALITLTTEWREDDFFYGILRGKLASDCPDATVVNNAGGIPPMNIMHGAFVIRNTYSHYPEGTIHRKPAPPPGKGKGTLVHRC